MPLLTDSSGRILAATRAYGDGREAMSLNFAQSPSLFHTLQLFHGVVSWATRGVFLGERHAYIGVQIDDLFLPDDIYTGGTFRMSGSDLQAAADYQNAKRAQTVTGGLRYHWAFNGQGASSGDELTVGGDAAREQLQLDQPHLRSLRSRRADHELRDDRAQQQHQRVEPVRPEAVLGDEPGEPRLHGPHHRGGHAGAVQRRRPLRRRRHVGAGLRQPVAQRRHLQPAAAGHPDDPAAPDEPLLQRVDARPVGDRVQRHLPVVLGTRSQLRRDPRQRERRAARSTC